MVLSHRIRKFPDDRGVVIVYDAAPGGIWFPCYRGRHAHVLVGAEDHAFSRPPAMSAYLEKEGFAPETIAAATGISRRLWRRRLVNRRPSTSSQTMFANPSRLLSRQSRRQQSTLRCGQRTGVVAVRNVGMQLPFH